MPFQDTMLSLLPLQHAYLKKSSVALLNSLGFAWNIYEYLPPIFPSNRETSPRIAIENGRVPRTGLRDFRWASFLAIAGDLPTCFYRSITATYC
jgi:hypothetical protein